MLPKSILYISSCSRPKILKFTSWFEVICIVWPLYMGLKSSRYHSRYTTNSAPEFALHSTVNVLIPVHTVWVSEPTERQCTCSWAAHTWPCYGSFIDYWFAEPYKNHLLKCQRKGVYFTKTRINVWNRLKWFEMVWNRLKSFTFLLVQTGREKAPLCQFTAWFCKFLSGQMRGGREFAQSAGAWHFCIFGLDGKAESFCKSAGRCVSVRISGWFFLIFFPLL